MKLQKGQIATMTDKTGKLSFAVSVIETKLSYGHERYMVRPVVGNGEAWVQSHRLEVTN